MGQTGDRSARDPPLGTCPACETWVPRENLLIAYETDDGWPKLFAECPSCREPIHPE